MRLATDTGKATGVDTDWVERVAHVRPWTKGGARAPHKPLLLLYALGRLQQAGVSVPVPYAEAEKPLDALLSEFGPPHHTSSVYPFYHLTSDRLWVIKTAPGLGSPGATKKDMRSFGAAGELAPDFADALLADPALFAAIVHLLLDSNFPPTLHTDICDQVGIDLLSADMTPSALMAKVAKKKRDPEFRNLVLMAYEKTCAMCGFDSQLDTDSPGLEAAHVRWFNIDGPDEPSNGLCLCSLHHKLLDKGAMGLTAEHTISVSARFISKSSAAQHFVHALLGKEIIEPQAGFDPVADTHIAWHTTEVFRPPAREVA